MSQEYFSRSGFVGDPLEPVSILTGTGGSPGKFAPVQWSKQSRLVGKTKANLDQSNKNMSGLYNHLRIDEDIYIHICNTRGRFKKQIQVEGTPFFYP